MADFPEDTVFVASGPDFPAEALNLGRGTEQALADLLREHGPERVLLYWQRKNGELAGPLLQQTVHTGRDDIAKYYLTTFTQARAFQKPLEIQIGWDS